MNLDVDLGGICIILDVTGFAFTQIINIREKERERGPWETDLIVISSEKAMGPASLFTLSYALKPFA